MMLKVCDGLGTERNKCKILVRKILGKYPIVRLRKNRVQSSDGLEEHGMVLVFLIMSTGSHCSEFITPHFIWLASWHSVNKQCYASTEKNDKIIFTDCNMKLTPATCKLFTSCCLQHLLFTRTHPPNVLWPSPIWSWITDFRFFETRNLYL